MFASTRVPRVCAALLAVLLLIAVIAQSAALQGALAAGGPGGGGGGGGGGAGTDTPPTGVVAPFVTPTLPDPAFLVSPADIHGFDDTGFIQDATVSADNSACPDVTSQHRLGGTVRVNGMTVTVPCNLVVQLPANTLTWADFVNGGPGLSLSDIGTSTTYPWPSFEVRVVGNIVAGERIAALMFVSQQALNVTTGVITGFDYGAGLIQVDSPAGPAVVRLNDPKISDPAVNGGVPTGRFSAGQSPDERFSVDQANPTVHAGTGYPMCIPRTDPAAQDDPLCPQRNRPLAPDCRNFSQAGVALPASGELGAPAPGQTYCTQFVMPAPPAGGGPTTGPDARQQAPFEVGDFITFSGTLVPSPGGDVIWAHTIEANVGIYTQPGTQPSYLAIGEFGIGSADPNATAVSGVPQEAADRMFLEAETTDVKTPVDIYLMDVDPLTGAVHNRWVTPFEMTGENQTGTPTGGITTQDAGPQPQRIRERANKAPDGILSQPTRTMRVVARSLCQPQNGAATSPALDACLDGAPTAANGLVPGQYVAPVFEFIFPENVKPGDAIVPFDLWHLPFLRFGEGAATPTGVGPLEPTPWGAAAAPSVSLPASVDFGSQTVGAPATTRTVSVTNSGATALTIGGVSVTGANAADFTVTAAPCLTVLAAGTSCTVTVSFAPGAPGARTARLQFVDDGVGSPQSVALTGTGTAAPAPVTTLSPTSVAFADQQVGTTSGAQSVTVSNTGVAPLTVSNLAVTGAAAGDFAVTGNTCLGGPVAPGGSCTVAVTFTPTATGSRAAQLTVASNAPAGPATVPLSGLGASAPTPPPPAFPAGPAPTFPGVTVPAAPTVTTVTGGNGSVVVLITTPANTGGVPLTGFQVQVLNATTGAVLSTVTTTGAGTPTAFRRQAASASTTVRVVINGLPNGVPLRVRVAALNAVGASPLSTPSQVVVPATVASAPRVTAVASGHTGDRAVSATVSWRAPASTGGAPVTAYRVTAIRSTGTRTTVTAPASARRLVVRGLARGQRYRFQVVAVNRAGAGRPSVRSKPVIAR